MAKAQCPRCNVALAGFHFGDAEVFMCTDCVGSLLLQKNMIPMMVNLTKDLLQDMDFNHEIEPVEPNPEPINCPVCLTAMEQFGYMGTNLVYAWRCSNDNWIWADPEELEAMMVLWARTKHRKNTRDAEADEEQAGLDRRIHATLRARFRGGMMGRGLLVIT